MKRIGILSFFPCFTPPRSGGELRLYHLATHLAGHGFDVQMAAPTFGEAKAQTIHHAPNFIEKRFPRTKVYNAGHAFIDRFAGFRESSGLVASIVCRKHQYLREEAERLVRDSDIITHESPFLQPLMPRERRRGQLLVYNSYNVEATLARAMFGRTLQGRLATRHVASLERALLRESDVVFACSEEDAQGFVTHFGTARSRIVVVPNGVDVDAIRPATPEQRTAARAHLHASANRPIAFFIGSIHPPNIEAVQLLLRDVTSQLPAVDFLIAGKVCEAFADRQTPPNVRLLGLVDETTKLALFHGADIALNPMISGSGTNLKMLDYLAAGLPILTTPVGARGLSIQHDDHAIIAQPDAFRTTIEELLTDGPRRTRIAHSGRALAIQRFSWKTIGDQVANLYNIKTAPRRVLIMTDFPVHPAEGGGQIRIEAVARTIASTGMAVSLLCLTSKDQHRRVQITPNIEEIDIPRGQKLKRINAAISAIVGCGADDASALLFAGTLVPEYRQLVAHEGRRAEIAMVSHPFIYPATKALPEGVRITYDSHNTEHTLKQKLYRPGILARFLCNRIRAAEIASLRTSQTAFCVSRENRDDLLRLVPDAAHRLFVTPNGVDTRHIRVRPTTERHRLRTEVGIHHQHVAIFLGSGHPPNAEAARIIIHQIAPKNPDTLFLIVGSVNGWFYNQTLPENIVLTGTVPHPVKDFLLQTADVALNPMLTGSGTSLKLFDFMAAGLPVITTAVGARGLEPHQRGGIIESSPEQFTDHLRALLADTPARERLAQKARRAAEEHFDWRVTLREMTTQLRHLPETATT